MATKRFKVTARHEQFRLDLLKAMRRYEDVPSIELLCVASQLVGQLVAMQDQTRYTNSEIMELIADNVQEGNRLVTEGMFGNTDGSA